MQLIKEKQTWRKIAEDFDGFEAGKEKTDGVIEFLSDEEETEEVVVKNHSLLG